MSGKLIHITIFLAMLSCPAIADCSAFRAEAGVASGIVPKFDEEGHLRALLSYGTASFIAPKPSLIDKARTSAELRAKRGFAEWLNAAVSSRSALVETIEINEETNQIGDTKALAQELTKQVEALSSNSEAALKGLVKLDECVDTADKLVMVGLGWRADLQEAAEHGFSSDDDMTFTDTPTSKVKPTMGYRIKSPLKDGF